MGAPVSGAQPIPYCPESERDMYEDTFPSSVSTQPTFPFLLYSADLVYWAFYRWVATQKNTRIPISMFHSSLQLSGMTIDSEEAECLVANMVYKGYMKGYISHGMQTVVLAAGGNAFPRVADIPTPFAIM